MVLIECIGTRVDDFFFPSFRLEEGEYLTLIVPYSFNSLVDKKVLSIFFGESKEEKENIKIYKNFTKIEEIDDRNNFFKQLFLNYTLDDFLSKKYKLKFKDIKQGLEMISPLDKISSLSVNNKRVIAIKIAIHMNKRVIINTTGVDYEGLNAIYKILEQRELDTTIIEIRYPTVNDFSFFEKSKKIILQLK